VTREAVPSRCGSPASRSRPSAFPRGEELKRRDAEVRGRMTSSDRRLEPADLLALGARPDFAWAQGQRDCTPSVRFALWRRIAAVGAAPRDESSARQCFMPEFADVSLWSSVLST
jgi:hypothetical protein